MKAYVIKTKTGYAGYAGNRHKLNEADIYPTKKKAGEDNIRWRERQRGDEEVIPVEIKLAKKKRKIK